MGNETLSVPIQKIVELIKGIDHEYTILEIRRTVLEKDKYSYDVLLQTGIVQRTLNVVLYNSVIMEIRYSW